MTETSAAKPKPERDKLRACEVRVHREGERVPCARLARLVEIRADRFHFRIEMVLCYRHRKMLKQKPDIRIRLNAAAQRARKVA